MKIGNIVSTSNINVSDEFNVVKTIDEINKELPTLIIGWDYVDKNYPTYDITNRVLGPKTYWTFKKTERRDQHDEDVQSFINKSYKDLVSNIPYVFIDPIQSDSKKLYKIIRKISNTKKIISFINKDMIYIYADKIIFGVDLKLLRYIGLNIDKIKNKIKSVSDVFLEDNNILIEYKKYVDGLSNQVRYIPFLYSINNE